MADNQLNKTSSSAGSIKWLLVGGMLIALAVWVYKRDDAQHYGEEVMTKTQGAGSWLSAVGDKVHHVYQCAASDKPTPVNVSVAPPVAKSTQPSSCCPACPPCATTPPYMDFGHIYGTNPVVNNDAVNAPTAPVVEAVAAQSAPAEVMPPNYPTYPGMPQTAMAAAPVTAPVNAVTPLPAAVVSKDMLRARNWVAQKKYEFAIIAYKKHIAAYPNDVNGYGEIGNVYLLAKHYPQAAQSFYEAANRLLDVGYVDEVQPMLPVITQYQPQLATQLKSKITLMGK